MRGTKSSRFNFILAAAVGAATIGTTTKTQAFFSVHWWANTGNTEGGTGIWDNTTVNWNDNVGGGGTTADTSWPDNADAFFGGTAGTVTLNTTVNIDSFTFVTTGYVFTGAGTINRTGGGAMDINSPITVTINVILAGSSGLSLFNGTTVLGAVNTYTGDSTLAFNSHLVVGGTGALGADSTGTMTYAGAANRVIINSLGNGKLGDLNFNGGITFNSTKLIAGSGTSDDAVITSTNGQNTIGANVTIDLHNTAFDFCVGETANTATATSLIFQGNIVNSTVGGTLSINPNSIASNTGTNNYNVRLGTFYMDGTLLSTLATNIGGGTEVVRNPNGISLNLASVASTIKPGAALWLDPRNGSISTANILNISGISAMSSTGSFPNGVPVAGGIRNVSGDNSFFGAITCVAGIPAAPGGSANYSIDVEDNSSLALKGGIRVPTAAGIVTLQGNGVNSLGTISGAITDGGVGKAASIIKSGTGTWIFSGNSNTYIGGTTVNGGTLLANNTAGSATGSGNITLNGGTFGGTGTVSGSVLAGSGNHTIAPSATLIPGSLSTLTLGGLTTSTQTTLSINLNSPGNSDKIAITGPSSLTLNGGTLAVNNAATNVGLLSLGYSKLISYSGSILGTGYTSIALPALSAGKIQYTLDIAHDANTIDLHRGFSGDANDDGLVNFSDFVLLSNHFGKPDMGWAGGDFNGDGITNFSDFVLLSNNFGKTVDGASELSAAEIASFQAETVNFGGGPSSVPEPASLALMGLGAAVLLKCRRKA